MTKHGALLRRLWKETVGTRVPWRDRVSNCRNTGSVEGPNSYTYVSHWLERGAPSLALQARVLILKPCEQGTICWLIGKRCARFHVRDAARFRRYLHGSRSRGVHGDSRTMKGDDFHVKVPGWDGDPKTWRTYRRKAIQYVEGTKRQDRYLCGPRLEARLTGRAEVAVERCKAGWLSRDD